MRDHDLDVRRYSAGDRYDIDINLAADTQAHLTTQSATKIQEMDAIYASQRQQITLGENAYLEYLPAAVIPYKNSRFLMQSRIVLQGHTVTTNLPQQQ
jgi:urease accessory protein